jgi:long-chain fatty acid transport protein
MRYIQGQFAAISQHRATFGVGQRDVLPGLDFDLFAGGMFKNTQQFASTIASIEGYWLGMGVTWRFGRGAAEYGEWTY